MCILTGEEVHDVTQAATLLADNEPKAVRAVKAYDADALLLCIAEKLAKVVIPPKANREVKRTFDWHHFRNRNVIERFLPALNNFRASQPAMPSLPRVLCPSCCLPLQCCG